MFNGHRRGETDDKALPDKALNGCLSHIQALCRTYKHSTYPVENVECPVGSEEENVVPVQIFHFSVPLQDNKLRHDRNRLEENRKGPQDFNQFEVVAARQQN